MHKGCALGLVALMILCSPVGSVTAGEKKPANAIRVLEATYGGNCEGVAKGNVTKFIASTCDGTDLCNYHVYYKKMGGDPAMECKKTFRVTFICGKNTKNPETCAWRPRRARRVRTARQTIFAFCTVSARQYRHSTTAFGAAGDATSRHTSAVWTMAGAGTDTSDRRRIVL